MDKNVLKYVCTKGSMYKLNVLQKELRKKKLQKEVRTKNVLQKEVRTNKCIT